MKLDELKEKKVSDLREIAKTMGIEKITSFSKDELIEEIMKNNPTENTNDAEEKPKNEKKDDGIAGGILEILPDGYGFLRSVNDNYLPGPEDIYVSPSQIKRFKLKTGHFVKGTTRAPKSKERFHALLQLLEVNGLKPDDIRKQMPFERYTPLHPNEKFNLSNTSDMSMRIMDLISPIGKGQRGLIVAQPPEEVTDMKRSVDADVVSSTFDEGPERHVQVSNMALKKAQRLVECGKDVVILLDSITRLGRAHNAVTAHSGKILSGGVDSNALRNPKKFFGAARNTEEGGSLTIIATALIDTGSKMDGVIFEEFKGTGNMELVLDRELSDRRIYPAFNIVKSGTRKEELLLSEQQLSRMWILRKMLGEMTTEQAMTFMQERMRRSKTNQEFLDKMSQ